MSDCDKTGCGKRLNIRHTLPCFLLAFAISSCFCRSMLAQLMFARSGRAQQRIAACSLFWIYPTAKLVDASLVGDCVVVGRYRVFVLV